jgi:2'-5' RNA ligase
MERVQYALVAYVRNLLGEFVDELRQELHPALAHLSAHVTVLPPRTLRGTEQEAIEWLGDLCSRESAFEATLGDPESFVPTTPTVFLRVEQAAYRIRELHDRCNSGPLQSVEQFAFMPHLTIVKMTTEADAIRALGIARERWAHYKGGRQVHIEQLCFVREDSPNHWIDLAPMTLGRSLVGGRKPKI